MSTTRMLPYSVGLQNDVLPNDDLCLQPSVDWLLESVVTKQIIITNTSQQVIIHTTR